MAIAESRGNSQADVITLAVVALDMRVAQGPVERPRKRSKKDAHVEALKASDPMGAERGDIEHGNMELPRGGSVAVVGAAGYNQIPSSLPPPIIDDNPLQTWRATRKPLLKPGDTKR